MHVSDDTIGPFIVTTDDGRMFHCSLPRDGGGERRWLIRDTSGRRHAGPPLAKAETPEVVQAIVNDWWALEKQRR
jgi:hypothetical protein